MRVIKYLGAARTAALCGIACTALVQPAAGQELDRERASILLGMFITDRASDVRLDSDQGDGTDIDFENDLGFDSKTTVGRLAGHYWFNERHRFDGSYFDLSRNSAKRIQETIDFGDASFPIDTTVGAEADFVVIKAAYTFSALNRDRGFFGITGGLYVAQTKFSLTAGSLTGDSESLTAPLPVIGVRGEYAITDRITIGGASEWFKFESEDVEGRLHDFYVGADYRFSKRFAVGLAYNDVALNVGANEDDGFEGRLVWAYDGFLLFAKYDF
jgi:hypothetical protein